MPDAQPIICGPEMMQAFAVLAAMLFIKHLAADGPLQTRYQVNNKGKFLHPGGLLHAGTHVGLSASCLLAWLIWLPVTVGTGTILAVGYLLVVEFAVHYGCDYAKTQVETRHSWSILEPTDDGTLSLRITSPLYFISFLADQTVHSLTYIWMIYAASSVVLSPAELAGLCGSGAS